MGLRKGSSCLTVHRHDADDLLLQSREHHAGNDHQSTEDKGNPAPLLGQEPAGEQGKRNYENFHICRRLADELGR